MIDYQALDALILCKTMLITSDEHQLEKAMRSGDRDLRRHAVRNELLPPALLQDALDDEDISVQFSAARNPSLTPEIVGTALAERPKLRAAFMRTRDSTTAAREVGFSALLQTELANRARLLSPDDLHEASDRLMGLIDKSMSKSKYMSPFGFCSSLSGGLSADALVASESTAFQLHAHGAMLLLVSEPSFDAIDDKLSPAMALHCELATEEVPVAPYLWQLLGAAVDHFEAIYKVAQDLAARLAADSMERDLGARQTAIENHRRWNVERLCGGDTTDGLFRNLPKLESQIWPYDDRRLSPKLQMLYMMQLILEHRSAVTSWSLFGPKS